jgi:hypothetical protein
VALTLVTGTGINLNAAPYAVIGVDLGQTPRSEVWFAPQVLGSVPQLAGFVDGPVKMTFQLVVSAASVSALQTAVNAVRADFMGQYVSTAKGGDNYILYSLGGTTKTAVTYSSPIDPVPLDAISADSTYAAIASQQFLIPRWTFSVWRQPYFYEDIATRQTPVI